MALDNIRQIVRNGNTFQLSLLSGITASRCIWKLTKPASAVINGPLKLIYKMWNQTQVTKKEGEDTNDDFGLADFLDLDFGKGSELITEVSLAFREIFASLTEDEYVALLVALFKGMTVQTVGNPAIVIATEEDFDKAFTGVMPDDVMLLALEVMRFNRFPFLRKVEQDFGDLLNQMNIFSGETENENG